MYTDFILNQAGHGEVGEMLQGLHFDPGYFRPFVGNDGQTYVTINTGRRRQNQETGAEEFVYRTLRTKELRDRYNIDLPVSNSQSLRKDQYARYEQAAVMAARQRLKAWTALESIGSYSGFDGMASYTLEYEAMSDPGEALIDMTGLQEGRNDQPLVKLRSLPLPIIHADFSIDERRLAVSRKYGTPLDTHMAEACGRRIAEALEKMTIGTLVGVNWGTYSTGPWPLDGESQTYGWINFPHTVIKNDFSVPDGTNQEDTVNEILSAISDLKEVNHFGPYAIYYSPDFFEFMGGDYARLGGNNNNQTLLDRILAIPGVDSCEELDYLRGQTFTLVIVEKNAQNCRAVTGMELTTVAWPSMGGLRKNYKMMCIKTPQMFADFDGNCGVLYGTTA